jgi:predicted Zn-dependent protease
MADSAAELFLLEAWVADNPGSRLFFKLAQAYKEAGRLEESAQVLQRGLVMHPAMVDARRLLAEVHGQMGDSEAALSQLMTAAAELCRHAGVFDGLASLWEAKGSQAEAKDARDLGQALAQGLRGHFKGHAPAEPPSAMPAMAAARPLEPPEPSAPAPGPSNLLGRLESMERAARQRVRG